MHWYNTHNPVDNPELTADEQLWIDRLNRIGIVYFRPLITASFIAPDVTAEERVNLFRHIERFIFIAFRMGRAFSSYRNSEFYRAARRLRLGEMTIDEIISTLDERMHWSFYTNDDKTYFDYSHFQKYIQKKFQGSGGFYQWNGLRYFLYEYELDKVQKRGIVKVSRDSFFRKHPKDKVSSEHILPQTATHQCWIDDFKDIEEEKMEYLTNSLGNLLLLSMSINASLQNDCFQDKKQAKFNDEGEKKRMGYNDGSHSEIEVAENTKWTPQEIVDRGIDLLSFIEKRWDIEFESESDKQEMLFLTFLSESKDPAESSQAV